MEYTHTSRSESGDANLSPRQFVLTNPPAQHNTRHTHTHTKSQTTQTDHNTYTSTDNISKFTHILTDKVVCPVSRACLSVKQEALVLAAAHHNVTSKKQHTCCDVATRSLSRLTQGSCAGLFPSIDSQEDEVSYLFSIDNERNPAYTNTLKPIQIKMKLTVSMFTESGFISLILGNVNSHQPEQSHSDLKKKFYVCISGGGWRALSGHMGAFRGLSDEGVLSQVDMFSSVSGGTWFLVKLAFDPAFAAKVFDNSTAIAEVVFQWFNSKYFATLQQVKRKGKRAEQPTHDDVVRSFVSTMITQAPAPIKGSFGDAIVAADNFDFSWQKMIEESVVGKDIATKTLIDAKLAPETRVKFRTQCTLAFNWNQMHRWKGDKNMTWFLKRPPQADGEPGHHVQYPLYTSALYKQSRTGEHEVEVLAQGKRMKANLFHVCRSNRTGNYFLECVNRFELVADTFLGVVNLVLSVALDTAKRVASGVWETLKALGPLAILFAYIVCACLYVVAVLMLPLGLFLVLLLQDENLVYVVSGPFWAAAGFIEQNLPELPSLYGTLLSLLALVSLSALLALVQRGFDALCTRYGSLGARAAARAGEFARGPLLKVVKFARRIAPDILVGLVTLAVLPGLGDGGAVIVGLVGFGVAFGVVFGGDGLVALVGLVTLVVLGVKVRALDVLDTLVVLTTLSVFLELNKLELNKLELNKLDALVGLAKRIKERVLCIVVGYFLCGVFLNRFGAVFAAAAAALFKISLAWTNSQTERTEQTVLQTARSLIKDSCWDWCTFGAAAWVLGLIIKRAMPILLSQEHDNYAHGLPQCDDFYFNSGGLTVGQVTSASSAAAGGGAVQEWVQNMIELARHKVDGVPGVCSATGYLLRQVVAPCNQDRVVDEFHRLIGCGTGAYTQEPSETAARWSGFQEPSAETAARWSGFLQNMAVKMNISNSSDGQTNIGQGVAIDAVRQASHALLTHTHTPTHTHTHTP